MVDWIEIAIAAGADVAEDVAAVIADTVPAARAGTEIRDGSIVFWTSIEAHERALTDTRAVVAELAANGLAVDPAGVRAQPAVPEAEWRDAWKRYFKVARLTRRIVVVPSWETFTPAADDVVIALDPGQAFGTGAHASTQLCLSALDELSRAGAGVQRFLDVGTGSGILAIATAKLWPAATGLAVDVDPVAVATARENADHNDVGPRVDTGETPAADIEGVFDVVLANIQAHVLTELRDALIARIGPGGALVMSGLLTAQVDDLAAGYAGAGLELVAVTRSTVDPEWSAAHLRRPAA